MELEAGADAGIWKLKTSGFVSFLVAQGADLLKNNGFVSLLALRVPELLKNPLVL